MRTVSGLDVHKDSIFMCILDEQGKKREEKFGVTTREIKRLSSVMHTHYVRGMYGKYRDLLDTDLAIA